MNPNQSALARKHLDHRLAELRGHDSFARPPRGWIRAIRDALGMTAMELGSRIGVSQTRATHLERGEIDDSITLKSLRAAAEALDCELVYALVPHKPLDALLRERAILMADRQLAHSSHTMALENQSLRSADLSAERDRLIEVMLRDPKKLWRSPK